MMEKSKVEAYLSHLDRLLAGEKILAPIEDEEVAELLKLAQKIIFADFSRSTESGERLKKQLVDRLASQDDGELTDEDLTYAAAGMAESGRSLICPICGQMMDVYQGKCPRCR